MAVILCLLLLPNHVFSKGSPDDPHIASVFVDEFQRLYDVDEQGALERFENEIIANDIYSIVRSMNLPGNSGHPSSRFDPSPGMMGVPI